MAHFCGVVVDDAVVPAGEFLNRGGNTGATSTNKIQRKNTINWPRRLVPRATENNGTNRKTKHTNCSLCKKLCAKQTNLTVICYECGDMFSMCQCQMRESLDIYKTKNQKVNTMVEIIDDFHTILFTQWRLALTDDARCAYRTHTAAVGDELKLILAASLVDRHTASVSSFQ